MLCHRLVFMNWRQSGWYGVVIMHTGKLRFIFLWLTVACCLVYWLQQIVSPCISEETPKNSRIKIATKKISGVSKCNTKIKGWYVSSIKLM